MQNNLQKKLDAVSDQMEKIMADMARYCHLLKHAQCQIENKMVCLIEKLNQKIRKWIT